MFIQTLLRNCRLLFTISCALSFYLSTSAQQLPSGFSGRILVKYDNKTTDIKKDKLLNDLNLRIYGDIPEPNIQILTLNKENPHPSEVAEVIKLLNTRVEVSIAESDQIVSALNTPNDSAFQYQWGMDNNGQNGGLPGADINAVEAWSNETGSEDLVMAIIDSGVDWTHPDLGDNIWQNVKEDLDGDGRVLEYVNGKWQIDPDDIDGLDNDLNGYADDFVGWNFVNNSNNPMDDHTQGHGTHVAGIAGARGNNGTGIAGVSWRSKIMPVKFLDENGAGFLSDAMMAFYYAYANGARVSNHSWGTYEFSSTLQFFMYYSQFYQHVIIAAAGNQFGSDNDLLPLYPANFSLDNVISVASTNANDEIAAFSNIGKISVDVAAPGEGIYSTLPNNRYGYLNGTSMAAPFVTGAAALLLAYDPTLTPADIKQIIKHTATPLASLNDKVNSGGRLNINAAIRRAYYLDSCSVKASFIVNDFTTCKGETITLFNTSQEDTATSSLWLVNDIVFDSAHHSSYTFNNEGNYQISLVSKNEQCSDTLTRVVEVQKAPIPNLQDTTLCAPAFALSAGVEKGVQSYSWKDTDGIELSTSETLTVNESGTYELTVVDQCNNQYTQAISLTLDGDCVWPGDINTDGNVDMIDFLSWGSAYGQSGPSRVDTGIIFRAYNSPEDWEEEFDESFSFADDVNYKYADCNGDGVVNELDLVAIQQNSNMDCDINGDPNTGSVSLSIQTFQDTVNLEDSLHFNVSLRSLLGTDVDSVAGIVFSVHSNIPLSAPLKLTTDNSWLGVEGSNLETMAISELSQNHQQNWFCTHAGMVRTDKKSGSGSGKVAESFIVIQIDDLGDVSSFSENAFLVLSVNQATIIKENGSIVPVNTLESQSTISVVVNLPKGNSDIVNAGFELRKWYPNPAQGTSTLEIYSQDNSKKILQLYNIMGSLISEQPIELKEGVNDISLSTTNLSPGMYFSVVKGDQVQLFSDILLIN